MKNGTAATRPKAGPASDTSTPCHSLRAARCPTAAPPKKGTMKMRAGPMPSRFIASIWPISWIRTPNSTATTISTLRVQ
jgi:hypothetical protein